MHLLQKKFNFHKYKNLVFKEEAYDLIIGGWSFRCEKVVAFLPKRHDISTLPF
jgi:hypothetical protein